MEDLPPYAACETFLPKFTHLPFPILLAIIEYTASSRARIEDQAAAYLWLSQEVRLTSRLIYRVVQHRLRTLYLPSYLRHIRPPFSSSPIPTSILDDTRSYIVSRAPPSYRDHLPSTVSTSETIFPPNRKRETAVLDLYIAASLRETAEGLQSDGFGELEDWREDLFVLYQPQARLTDLLLSSPTLPCAEMPFPRSDLSLRFTPRRVAVIRIVGGRRRDILAFDRAKGEKEEVTVARIESGLRRMRGKWWIEGDGASAGQ